VISIRRAAAFLGATSLLSLSPEAFPHGMKIPGETSVQSNIIKPVPLDATESRMAALKVPAGLKVEKLIEGLKTPRVIVATPPNQRSTTTPHVRNTGTWMRAGLAAR
jgi:hypothetical protein